MTSSLIDKFKELKSLINFPPILIEKNSSKKNVEWEIHQTNLNNLKNNHSRNPSLKNLPKLT